MSIQIGRNRNIVSPAPVGAQPSRPPAKSTQATDIRATADVSSFEPAKQSALPKAPPATQPAVAEAPKKKGFFARMGDALGSIVAGVGGAAAGIVQNLGEAAKTFVGGLGKAVTGNLGEGFEQMGRGLVKVVQTPVDAVLLAGGHALGAVQTLIGVEPVGRKLSGTEIAELRKVYGDTIDYSLIRVKEGDSGLLSISGRAFVMGNTIYMPKTPFDMSLLVHEVGHVWQYQTGGSDYLSEALYAQFFGDAYDWQKGIADGKSWAELDPEQQAQLIQNAWDTGYFDAPEGRFIWRETDYTDYLRTALAELHAGRGAP